MVFCTEFLDGWWSWKPLRRSCVRCGWCREAKVFCIGLYFQLDEPSAVSLSSALLRSALRPTTHLPLPHTTELICIIKYKSNATHRTSRSSGHLHSRVFRRYFIYIRRLISDRFFGIFFTHPRNMPIQLPSKSFPTRYSLIILPRNTAAGWKLDTTYSFVT